MLSLIFIILAGICNAVCDVLFTQMDRSIFSNLSFNQTIFWDVRISWRNKWKSPLSRYTKNQWFYFGFNPIYEERFTYSSSILVFLTDGWHLTKAIMLLWIMLAVVCYEPIITPLVDLFILYGAFTFTFTIFYEKILIKK